MENSSFGLTSANIAEAGAKGLLRNLCQADDDKFDLVAAILFPADILGEAVAKFRPGFVKFRNATPRGAKVLFTDAHSPGNGARAAVGNELRDEFINLTLSVRPMIVYGAQRLRLARSAYESNESLKSAAKGATRSDIRIAGADGSSDHRMEDDLILSLSLRLDGFGEMVEHNGDVIMINLLFDQPDKATATRYDAR